MIGWGIRTRVVGGELDCCSGHGGRHVRLVGVAAVVGIVRLSFRNPVSRKTFSAHQVGLGTLLRLATLYSRGSADSVNTLHSGLALLPAGVSCQHDA